MGTNPLQEQKFVLEELYTIPTGLKATKYHVFKFSTKDPHAVQVKSFLHHLKGSYSNRLTQEKRCRYSQTYRVRSKNKIQALTCRSLDSVPSPKERNRNL